MMLRLFPDPVCHYVLTPCGVFLYLSGLGRVHSHTSYVYARWTQASRLCERHMKNFDLENHAPDSRSLGGRREAHRLSPRATAEALAWHLFTCEAKYYELGHPLGQWSEPDLSLCTWQYQYAPWGIHAS